MLRVSTPVKAHLQVQHPSYKDFHFSSLPMCGFSSLNSTNYKHEKECFNVHFRLVQKSIAEIFLTSFHLNISGYYLLVRALCNHSIKIISLKMAAFTKNLHFEVLLKEKMIIMASPSPYLPTKKHTKETKIIVPSHAKLLCM